ncbi:hypothetical protein PINS_up009846 [Pythium insidiosum]|nr:hypothetical protein PINS_up009846 [Pythium insidiosum]
MLKGMLDYLTGPSSGAAVLRNHFVFKVVPMLNPDGVIHGNTRVNLAGWDLNRKWSSPVEKLFPTVYHLKRLISTFQSRDRVAIFCDLHGHSINRNIFTYGCYNKKSTNTIKRVATVSSLTEQPTTAAMTTMTESSSYVSISTSTTPPSVSVSTPTLNATSASATVVPSLPSLKNDPRVFPMIVAKHSEFFSFANCDFKVHKSKLNTARVVVNHELGVINSYTLEASFCGPDFGPRKDTQFSTWDLEDMGRTWCQSLLVYFGLLPQVRALDRRREAELLQQQQQQHNELIAVEIKAASGAESSPEHAAISSLLPEDDLLSDCETAISELFATISSADLDGPADDAGVGRDSCDSDLSGAEDAIPPNADADGDRADDMSRASRREPSCGYSSAPEDSGASGGMRKMVTRLRRRTSTRHKKLAEKRPLRRRESVKSRRQLLPPGDDDNASVAAEATGDPKDEASEQSSEAEDELDDADGDSKARSKKSEKHKKHTRKKKKKKRKKKKKKNGIKSKDTTPLARRTSTMSSELRAATVSMVELPIVVVPDKPRGVGPPHSHRLLRSPAVCASDDTDDASSGCNDTVDREKLEISDSVTSPGHRSTRAKLARIGSGSPLELPLVKPLPPSLQQQLRQLQQPGKQLSERRGLGKSNVDGVGNGDGAAGDDEDYEDDDGEDEDVDGSQFSDDDEDDDGASTDASSGSEPRAD